MTESESVALPFGYSPLTQRVYYTTVSLFGQALFYFSYYYVKIIMLKTPLSKRFLLGSLLLRGAFFGAMFHFLCLCSRCTGIRRRLSLRRFL
jgi:hypothetical protein